jgi:hypothetical protein
MDTFRTLLAAFVLLAFAATPAWACRVGFDQILFEERPQPIALEGAKVIFVRFIRDPAVFERGWPPTDPQGRRGRSALYVPPLIGLARLDGGQDLVPVYARVTSCVPGWFGLSAPPHNSDAYLVGRWMERPKGARAFQAGGEDGSTRGEDQHWHY